MEADATCERSRATSRINLGVSRSESENAFKRPRTDWSATTTGIDFGNALAIRPR